MKLLRQLPTRRLLVMLAAVAALGASAGAIAVTASGGSGPTPAPKPLAEAIHDAVTAPDPKGVTASISFTNNLFPSGALFGSVGSALMSGGTGRLWMTDDGRGRLELQSGSGDTQITWSGRDVSIYDASSNTVYRYQLPSHGDSGGAGNQPPTLDEITSWLGKIGQDASVSGPEPGSVAGQPAYTVTVSPKHDGGLLGSAQLAWDALQGVPLRVAVYAQGDPSPVLELTATDISYGPVASSDVDVSPPAGAKTVDLGTPSSESHAVGDGVSGLDAVRAALPFPLVAPDSLVGLPRKTVRLIGSSDSKGALVVYGQGLGAIVVVERPATRGGNGLPGVVPKVSLDGITAAELATQLGTVLQFDRDGVGYVLAGSLPPAAAEAAARSLR